MKNLWKRLLSGVLCVLLLAALIPTGVTTAFAAEPETNLASGKTVEADSSSNEYQLPELAVDGNTNSYWCANGAGAHWIQVDLGAVKSFDQIKMLEYPASTENPPVKHKIELSVDKTTWFTLTELNEHGTKSGITAAAGELDLYTVNKAAAARYIKITVDCDIYAWPTMYELEVYNTTGAADPVVESGNLASGKTVEANSWSNEYQLPELAVDGDTNSYWCANGAGAHWIQVDLGAVKSFDQIKMLEYPASTENPPVKHKIELSMDKTTWFTLTELNEYGAKSGITAAAGELDLYTVNKTAAARYIKITVDCDIYAWPTMYELEVYNTKAATDSDPIPTLTNNLAKGKDITASENNGSTVAERFAIDGDYTSYWCGDDTKGTHWLQVDLGAVKSFDTIRLYVWGNDDHSIYTHQIETSSDGESWTTLATVSSGAVASGMTVTVPIGTGTHDVALDLISVEADAAARYIKVSVLDCQWPSMFELEVYNTKGTADPTPALPEDITEITEPLEIEVWDRADIVLTSSVDYTADETINPYSDILVDATFTHEDGTVITTPGFWNGGTEYRVRFCPTKTGNWTYLITCNKIDNSGLFQKGTINAVANTSDTKLGQKGYIQLDEDGRYFTYADGTPFYWLGDTHWQSMNYEYISQCNYPGCDCGNQFKHIVDDRLEKGFNVYQTYFSSEVDTEAEAEKNGYAFETSMWDTDAGYDLYELVNVEAFSERIDYMFDYLADNDMVIALGFGIANSTYNALGFENFSDLTRYLTARYAAYPVVWIGGQEVDYATSGDVSFNAWLKLMQQIDDLDGYDHPMTVHMWPIYGRGWDSKNTLNTKDWHEFWMLQAGHVQSGKTDVASMTDKATYETYWKTGKTILESEAFYEDIRNGSGAPYNGYRASRIAAWKANLCGSCGFTYGATGIWTNSYSTYGNTREHLHLYSTEPWYMGLDKEGSYEMTYLKNFFEYVEFYNLIPRFNDTAYSNLISEDKLVSSSADGSTYIGYFYNSGLSTGEFRGLDTSKTYTASWYNPLTGKFVQIGTADVSADGVYQIPEKPTTADWAIVVTSKELGTQKMETAYTDAYVQNSANLTSKVKNVTDYHYEGSSADPWAAIDGNDDTYWNGMWVGEFWLELEFEETIEFNEICMLFWPDATTDSYKIEISEDGETWTEYASGENEEALTSDRITNGHFSIAGQYLSEYIWNKEASARYLRVTLADTDGWPTIFELEIYNKTDAPTLEDGVLPTYAGQVQAVTAKTVGGAIYDENDTLTDTKANLTDGDVSTVWTPFASIASQAIILDMKERKELTGMIVTLPDGAYLPEYRIEGSVNGSDWTILADATLRDAQVTTVDGLQNVCETLSGKYRYVKLLWLGAPSRDNDKSIAEIQLFAEENASPVIADKTALAAAIADAEALKLNNYLDGPAKETFKQALADANEVYDNADATQAEVDAATAALIEAQEALEKYELLVSLLPVIAEITGTTANFPFTDVRKTDWFYDDVRYIYEEGMMNGVDARTFNPYGQTTRGMIVTILARLDGVNTAGSSPWYAAGRTWAMAHGISDGTNMDAPVTREQLATILYRYASYAGLSIATSADHLTGFADGNAVSDWARAAMNWAVECGLVKGSNGLLDPQGSATRAQVAAILHRFMKK